MSAVVRSHPASTPVFAAMILMCTGGGGCHFISQKDLEEAIGVCETTIYDGKMILAQDPLDLCRHTYVASSAEFGSGFIMEATGPADVTLPSGDTLSLDIGGDLHCLEPEEISDDYLYTAMASSYVADYDTSSCSSNCTLGSVPTSVTVPIRWCDVDEQYAGQEDSSTPPPPVENTYTASRTGHAFSGQWWYTILERHQGEVCTLYRWAPPGESLRYALTLAQETNLGGGAKRYDLIDQVGFAYITGATTATVTASGSNRQVVGTTGNSTLNEFYGVGGTWTFTPTVVAGGGWGATALHWGHKLCTRLRASGS